VWRPRIWSIQIWPWRKVQNLNPWKLRLRMILCLCQLCSFLSHTSGTHTITTNFFSILSLFAFHIASYQSSTLRYSYSFLPVVTTYHSRIFSETNSIHLLFLWWQIISHTYRFRKFLFKTKLDIMKGNVSKNSREGTWSNSSWIKFW
jgi:hypothetical protein